MFTTITRPAIAAIAVSASIAGLGACASRSSTATVVATSPSACTAPPATAQTSKPVIAVLAGVTPTDQGPALTAERSSAMSMIVSAGFAMQGRLLVDEVGAGLGDANLVVNTQLEADGPNPLFRQSDVACKKAGISEAFSALLQRGAAGPLDVLSALRSLQSHLTGLTTTSTDVVVMSNMINATPPLRLNDPATLAQGPATLISAVVKAGLMPVCRGWNVYIVGGGRTATGGVSDTTNAELEAFWSAFFAHCGGRVVLYDSALTQFPVRGQPASPIAPPVQPPPPGSGPPTSVGRQRQLVVTLPDSVLFASASATLAPGTAAVLGRLLSIATAQCRPGTIDVTGYTDTVPIEIPGGNLALSQQRSEAVGAWLIGHGVPADCIRTAGAGPADPIGTNTTASGRAQNRRVEVSVTVAAAS